MIRSVGGMSLLGLCVLAAPFALSEEKKAAPPKAAKGFQMTKEEQALLELVNKERAKEKLPPLKPHPLLFKAARAHSANMAKQGKMEHILNGKKPADRVQATGYDWKRVTENLITADQTGVPPEKIVEGWLKSPTHKVNILDEKVTETGLGIATNAKGEVYYTQVFAHRRGVPLPRIPKARN